jgi:hypothetical protein
LLVLYVIPSISVALFKLTIRYYIVDIKSDRRSITVAYTIGGKNTYMRMALKHNGSDIFKVTVSVDGFGF